MSHPTDVPVIDVLVVDPSSDDAGLTVAAVRRAVPSASTVRVQDAKHAIRLIFDQGLFTREPQVPRLIFLEPNGIALNARVLLQRLRARTATRNVPVIVLSDCARAGEIAQSYLMGARDHIVKPPRPAQYLFEVERATAQWL
jgi:CheY-like chemotaxis protein